MIWGSIMVAIGIWALGTDLSSWAVPFAWFDVVCGAAMVIDGLGKRARRG